MCDLNIWGHGKAGRFEPLNSSYLRPWVYVPICIDIEKQFNLLSSRMLKQNFKDFKEMEIKYIIRKLLYRY